MKVKKMFLKTLLIFLSIVFIQCESSNAVDYDYLNNQSSYFPLKIGNKWYYNSNTDPFDSTSYNEVWEVKTNLWLFQKNFYLIEKTRYFLDGSIKYDSMYYCLSNDTLLQFHPSWESSESSISTRAIFSSNQKFTMKWLDFEYEAYSKNQNDSVITFTYYIPGGMDSGFETTFHKNIGITKSYSYFVPDAGIRLVDYEFK